MLKHWKLLFFLAALALHICMLLSLHGGFLNPLFHDSAPHMKGRGADFFTFYSSGRYFLEGRDLYTYPEHPVVPYAYLYFSYLPVFGIILGCVMNLFPPDRAYVIWVLAIELCLIVNLFLTHRLCRTYAPGAFLPAAAMWLGFTPYYVEIYMGQANFFMASAVFFMCAAFLAEKKIRAGFWWILSLFLKMATFIFIPLLWIHRQRKTAITGLVLVCLTTAVYFIAMPGKTTTLRFSRKHEAPVTREKAEARKRKFPKITEQVMDRAVHIPLSDRLPDITLPRGLFLLIGRPLLKPQALNYANNPGVSSFIFSLTDSMTWVNAARILSLLFSLWLTLARKPPFCQGVVLWILTFFIAYTFTWEHHFVFLLPAVILFYIFGGAARPLIVLLYLPLALPTLYGYYQTPAITAPLYYATKSVPVLGLYFLIAFAMMRGQFWKEDARRRD